MNNKKNLGVDKSMFCFMFLCILFVLMVSVSYSAVPVITSITPDIGTAINIDVNISGSNFEPGASVSLLQGEPSISLVLPGRAYDVFLLGNYAYFACGSDGLQIVDVSNPEEPVLVGGWKLPSFPLLTEAKGIYVVNNYAYLAYGRYGLQIIDVSNPENPSAIGYYQSMWYAYDVYVEGNYAYVAKQPQTIEILDISVPSSPIFVGSDSNMLGIPAFSLQKSGNYLYCANSDSGLKIFDVTDPANLVLVGQFKGTSHFILDVYISGNYAYLADSGKASGLGDEKDAALYILDISDPTLPSVVGIYRTPDCATRVFTEGDYAYVTVGDYLGNAHGEHSPGLLVLDVSNHSLPVLVGYYSTPSDCPLGIYKRDEYAYIADSYSSLQVIKINNPVTNVVIENANTITATFPAMLPEGSYDVLVTNPGGEEGYLYNGFNVVSYDKLGLYKEGLWILDKNGNGTWDNDTFYTVFGDATYVPVAGDWNGDGITNIGLYKDGIWLFDMNNNGQWDSGVDRYYDTFGDVGYIPVVGDWNGDGITNIGLYKDGIWLFDMNNNGQWDSGVDRYYDTFGDVGYIPVVGDWNGDGITNIGLYKDGLWLLDINGNGLLDNGVDTSYYGFGGVGYIPVAGDWNGDGVTDIGLYKDGLWLLDMNNNGQWDASEIVYEFGDESFIPVSGQW